MNRPQVAYFLSGVLAHFPSGARTARAVISEEGGCACSLLSDQADWNADIWAMRPEILEQLARTLQILVEEGPPNLSVQALSVGEPKDKTVRVTAATLGALARSSRLGMTGEPVQ